MSRARTTHHPVVGAVRWRPLDGGRIEILGHWVEENIVTVHIPQLEGVSVYGKPFSGRVRFYKGAVEQLKAAWAEVEQRGVIYRVLTWDGSFVPRLVRGSRSKPSNHAFGTAFDINARWNGLGLTPPAAGLKGSVRELVPFFEKHGFRWGGNWRRPDGMHFEVATLTPERGRAYTSVEIFIDGLQKPVPALLLNNETWVGIRALSKFLGWKIVSVVPEERSMIVNGNIRLSITVAKSDEKSKTTTGANINGTGYIRIADVKDWVGTQFSKSHGIPRIDLTTY